MNSLVTVKRWSNTLCILKIIVAMCSLTSVCAKKNFEARTRCRKYFAIIFEQIKQWHARSHSGSRRVQFELDMHSVNRKKAAIREGGGGGWSEVVPPLGLKSKVLGYQVILPFPLHQSPLCSNQYLPQSLQLFVRLIQSQRVVTVTPEYAHTHGTKCSFEFGIRYTHTHTCRSRVPPTLHRPFPWTC